MDQNKEGKDVSSRGNERIPPALPPKQRSYPQSGPKKFISPAAPDTTCEVMPSFLQALNSPTSGLNLSNDSVISNLYSMNDLEGFPSKSLEQANPLIEELDPSSIDFLAPFSSSDISPSTPLFNSYNLESFSSSIDYSEFSPSASDPPERNGEIEQTLYTSSMNSLGSASSNSSNILSENNSHEKDFESISELKNKISRLQAERDFLRQEIQNNTLITQVIQQIARQHPFAIHHFRSFEDKNKLLEAAVITANSIVILQVIFFLKDHLLPNLFVEILSKHSIAVNLYSSYLRQRNNITALQALYRFLRSPVEEAKLLLSSTYEIQEPKKRLSSLRTCYEAFQKEESLHFYAEQLNDQIALLERQIMIEEHDLNAAKHETIYLKHPRFSLPFRPLSDTLWYCFFYHAMAHKTKLSSPENLEKTFKLTEKRFLRCQLSARAKIGDWEGIKEIAVSRKGLFSKTPKSPIGFEPYVEVCVRSRSLTGCFRTNSHSPIAS